MCNRAMLRDQGEALTGLCPLVSVGQLLPQPFRESAKVCAWGPRLIAHSDPGRAQATDDPLRRDYPCRPAVHPSGDLERSPLSQVPDETRAGIGEGQAVLLGHFPVRLVLSVSSPGLSRQSRIHGRWLLDRPVKPGDDSLAGATHTPPADVAPRYLQVYF